jgi:hypothetical protein
MKRARKFNGKIFNLYYTDKSKLYVQKGANNLRKKKKGLGTSWNVRVVKGKDRNGKVVYGLYRRAK